MSVLSKLSIMEQSLWLLQLQFIPVGYLKLKWALMTKQLGKM